MPPLAVRSIGFAGVGIKLGLLISEDVITESRTGRSHLATTWRLSSKNRASHPLR